MIIIFFWTAKKVRPNFTDDNGRKVLKSGEKRSSKSDFVGDTGKKKFVLPLLLLLQIAPLNTGEKRSAAAYIKVLRRRHVGV
ncbi:hypothetical protein T01_5517 [Trichinella spiralis]|uniref:Uncharacterized protein n=1 Tax=Trichinella spiralis TaxID=6334 RepID=A0A0V1BR26_TRISP|nr:hypothetical protein T01_5517 [Trichinella spiralis]